MIRPGMVSMARMMIDANSNVEIGTVIDFPEGGQDWRLSLMKRFRQFRMMLMICL
jgi:deoxyribose-phosphate aldolase